MVALLCAVGKAWDADQDSAFAAEDHCGLPDVLAAELAAMGFDREFDVYKFLLCPPSPVMLGSCGNSFNSGNNIS